MIVDKKFYNIQKVKFRILDIIFYGIAEIISKFSLNIINATVNFKNPVL